MAGKVPPAAVVQSPIGHAQRRGGHSRIAKQTNITARALDGRVSAFPKARFLKFIEKLRIQSKDYGVIPFELLGSQVYLLDEIEKAINDGATIIVILKSRQLGASTFFLALDLFWAFEYQGLLGAFVCHEEAARDKFRVDIDVYLDSLPRTHKVDSITNNAKMLVLQNQSRFQYMVAGQRATTNKLGRSTGINFCHSTEVAFWGSSEDLAALNQTFSDLYPHRLYIYESTANGYNHFEEMWQTAKQSPAQRAIFVGWWRDERNEFGENHPGYKFYMPQGAKTPLSEREKDGINAVRKEYNFRVTAGQIAWYRYHLENKCANDQQQMDQEQPWVPEDAFQSTGSVYFQNRDVTKQMKFARSQTMQAYNVRLGDHWSRMELVGLGQSKVDMANLKIWEGPDNQWGRYTIGVDVAYGSSPDNDDTVVSVFKCYSNVAVQVAEYVSASCSTYQCAWIIAYLGGLYRDCMVNLEITGPGADVQQHLTMLRREAHAMVGPESDDIRNALVRMKEFLYRRSDSLGGSLVRHWKTTPGGAGTKPLLMGRFKSYVELDMARINSLACLEQMRKIRIDGGSIEAPSGKDDRVVAAALAVYAWTEWRLPVLKRDEWSFERVKRMKESGAEDQIDGMVRRFMAQKRINVKDVNISEA